MKFLILGGAGFIGSHIADRLIEMNYPVYVVDNLSHGKIEHVHPGVRFIKADITHPGLEQIISSINPTVVYHQAAQINVQTSMKNPLFDANTNVLGTINVLKCCVNTGVKKIVYASSAAAYGPPLYMGIDEAHPRQPISHYGISKYASEMYLETFYRLYGLNYTVLRYANVYGARQDCMDEAGVVAAFIKRLMDGERPVIYGDGSQTRDFVYVKDVVEANIAAISRGRGQTYNIGTGSPVSVLSVFLYLRDIIGADIDPLFELPRPGDIKHSFFNTAKAERELGWEARYPLSLGLKETWHYYCQMASSTRAVSMTITAR